MSSTAQQQWNPINENIEDNEAQLKDAEYQDLLWKELDLDSAAKALWGIWAIAPEDGELIAADAIAKEQAERWDLDNIDWWDAFDTAEETTADWKVIDEKDTISWNWNQDIPVNEASSKVLLWSEWWDILNSQQEEDPEQLLKMQEWIYSPAVKQLVFEWIITADQAQAVKKSLLKENIDDINNIPNEELGTKEKQSVIERLKESTNVDTMEKYAKNFEKDFGSQLSDFKSWDWEYTTETDSTAYEMISVRYISSKEWEVTPEAKKVSLNTAFETALNVEINGKQIEKNESYKQIVKDINNDSLTISKRFEAFKDLLAFTTIDQAKWWRQQSLRYRQRVAEWKLADIWRNERFAELLEVFKNAEKNSSEALQAAWELEAIRIEADITSWDANLLAWGWEMEVATDNISENTSLSA